MHKLDKLKLAAKFTVDIPLVKGNLDHWLQISATLPRQLRRQAQASIETKTFHCLGGSIYMHYPHVERSTMLTAIVALQTISDYLDNLCDRMNINDEKVFAQLHLSFMEALDSTAPLSDYYRYYPYRETTYLPALVACCQAQVGQMPYYKSCKGHILELAHNYCRLQVLKHLRPQGEMSLKEWVYDTFPIENGLEWNEWAAAAGSTLGIFALFAASYTDNSPQTIAKIFHTYFPWIQALHILLDYYIDRHEDSIHGDLNFTTPYSNIGQATERLQYFYQQSKARSGSLPCPFFHELTLQGLVALYGSDPKLKEQDFTSQYRIMVNTPFSALLYQACLFLRKTGYLP